MTVAGAVYTPLVEIVPIVIPPPTKPLTSQVTVVSVALVTVAVNVTVPLAFTVCVAAGETATPIAGGVVVAAAFFLQPQPPKAAAQIAATRNTRFILTGLRPSPFCPRFFASTPPPRILRAAVALPRRTAAVAPIRFPVWVPRPVGCLTFGLPRPQAADALCAKL